jgi:undecaprenyl-diphosphatase
MPLLQVIVLAIVQGLTEFLPVSSSAHLYLTSWLLGWQVEDLTFDIALHLGTLIAVLIYFFRAWVQIIGQAFGFDLGTDKALKLNRALLWYLAIASIPVGVCGYLFKGQAETTWRNPWLIGSMLIIVGGIMWLAERVSACRKGLGEISLIDSIWIGISQAFAIVPGTSRSGITISAALFRDIDRPSAARFSFLLSTPAIAGAAAHAFHELYKHGGIPPEMRLTFVLGIALSTLTGCVVIAWFLRYMQRGSLKLFVYYRVIFGIIVIALAAFFRPAG